MKKLINRFLVPLFITGLIFTGASFTRAQSNTSSQTLSLSKYGTLSEIFDAKGQSRFGKLNGDGFEITYQIKGKTISVSAVGDEVTGLAPGKVKTAGQTATAVNTTSDNALEITTYFRLNEKTKKLTIQRNFKNISKDQVVVLTLQEYLSPALVISSQLSSEPVSDKLVDLIKSQLAPIINLGDCNPAECPKAPPACPIPCPMKLTYDPSRLTIRPNPSGDKPATIMLPWNGSVSMEPSASKTNQVSTVSYIDVPM